MYIVYVNMIILIGLEVTYMAQSGWKGSRQREVKDVGSEESGGAIESVLIRERKI